SERKELNLPLEVDLVEELVAHSTNVGFFCQSVYFLFLFITIYLGQYWPCTVTAAEANDTTVNYQGRKYVIGTNDTETKITVYEKDSVKIKESMFADGNKIGRTYVSSPFAGNDELQSMKFKPMLPTFWLGSNILKGGLFKSGDKTGAKFGGSFEAGITPLRMAIPLDKAKTFGIISGAQLVFSRYCFDKNFGMRMSDGLVDASKIRP
ncbi:MAG: hypothetical protein J6B91_11470, partial [Prevotella sp.]|nr:hypothetical protein [Prevotella sp.]